MEERDRTIGLSSEAVFTDARHTNLCIICTFIKDDIVVKIFSFCLDTMNKSALFLVLYFYMYSFNEAGVIKYVDKNNLNVPDHDRGRPMEVNACILITHMVYL